MQLDVQQKEKKNSFECGYSFCQLCLREPKQLPTGICPIEGHQRCKLIQSIKDDGYVKNVLDKKVKIAVVGSKGAGKTSFIRAMNNNLQLKTKHTISIDVVAVTRQVNGLKVQYNLWDTVSQSSIFEGFDSTFKNSDIQIIVSRGESAEKIRDIFQYVKQNTQRSHIIIIDNQIAGPNNQKTASELENLLKGKKYRYVKFNCLNIEEVKYMWGILDIDCIRLKQSQSKLLGVVIPKLKQAKVERKQSCSC